MIRLSFRSALAISTLAAAVAVVTPARSADPLPVLRLPADAPFAPDVRQLTRGLRLSVPTENWKDAKALAERARDKNALAVYAKAATGIVVVRSGGGHGTGFLVGKEGWVVTNHHVIEEAEVDPATGAGRALIHLGTMTDGAMTLQGGPPLEALVYKTSPKDDLALLKLTDPKAVAQLPAPLAIAAKAPAVGSECYAIGHPGVSLLWSIRPGTVSAVGDFPQDRAGDMVAQLQKGERNPARLPAAGADVPRRKTVFSNCLIYCGDSGGPLLNAEGEVVAVTFAVAATSAQPLLGFSYHVHRDPLVAFLKDKPEFPVVSQPDPWPPANRFKKLDLDGDDTPETLLFGQGDKVTGLLIDPDQNAGMPGEADFSVPAKRDGWRFRLAIHFHPHQRVFYDTDGDGKIDLILLDTTGKGNGTPDAQLALVRDKWVRSAAKSKTLLDPSLFKLSDESRKRLDVILKKIAK